MRIVYNLRDQNWETTKSLGVLNVSLRILEGLTTLPGIERIDVFANRSLAGLLPRSAGASQICHYHHLETAAPRGWSRLIWDQWSLVRRTNSYAADWLLLPKGFAPLIRWPRTRVSAYVHDDIFAYYQSIHQSPFPSGESTLFSRSLARTARRADVIVTNSQFTAAEFAQTHRPKSRPVRVGAPLPTHRSIRGSAGDALLLMTSTWPHKLTAQAIEWLTRWQTATGSTRVIHGIGELPGDASWPARPNWIHRPRLAPEAYAQLQSQVAAMIYFSAYEGYGLPPVEAAAEGMRTVASDLPPLRETLPASCLFSNRDYDSFHETLNRVLASPPVPPLRIEEPSEVAASWLAALQKHTGTPSH